MQGPRHRKKQTLRHVSLKLRQPIPKPPQKSTCQISRTISENPSANARKALEEANDLITKKGLRQRERTTRAAKTTRTAKTQAIPAIEDTDAATVSSSDKDALELPTGSQYQKRIAALYTAAAGVSLDARLLIAYPENSSHLLRDCSVIPLQQTLDKDGLFAIVQTEDDVDFQLLLPTYQQSSITELDEIQIAYDINSNTCYLRHRTKATNNIIRVTSLRTGIEHAFLRIPEYIPIDPGVWRVSVRDPYNKFNATIDILVLARPYEVVICGPQQEAAHCSGKRPAVNDLRHEKSAKRRRGPSGNIFSSRNIVHSTPMLQKLCVGGIAEISSERPSQGYACYTLKKERSIHENGVTGVYKCRHSNIKEAVAAKVFLQRSDRTLFEAAEAWKKEREVLKLLKHVSVPKRFI